MKTFHLDLSNNDFAPKDAVEFNIGIERQQKLEHSERKIKGLTVWQKNLATGEITKAELEPVYHVGKTIDLYGIIELKTEAGFTFQVKKKEGFAYLQALNLKTATKKFNK